MKFKHRGCSPSTEGTREKCAACVIMMMAAEIKRLKAALRENAYRNKSLRKKLRRS